MTAHDTTPSAGAPPMIGDRWSAMPQVWFDSDADGGGATPSAPAAGATESSTPAPSAGNPPAPADGGGNSGNSEPDPFGELPNEPVFDRGYVEKLRGEGAKYRTQVRELTERFEPHNDFIEALSEYPDDDRAVWLDLMRGYRNDPVATAETFQNVAQAILEANGVSPQQAQQVAEQLTEQGVEGDDGPLTAEKVQELIAADRERVEAERQKQADVEQVFTELTEAGYERGSREAFTVLWIANNETNGDIAKAIEIDKANKQKVIDEYVESVKNKPNARTAPEGKPGSGITQIKNLADARKATEAMISGLGQ